VRRAADANHFGAGASRKLHRHTSDAARRSYDLRNPVRSLRARIAEEATRPETPQAAAAPKGSFSGFGVSQRSSTAQTSAQAPLLEKAFAPRTPLRRPGLSEHYPRHRRRFQRSRYQVSPSIRTRPHTYGDSAVEGSLSHMNIVDVDAGPSRSPPGYGAPGQRLLPSQ
jgi:hypothetical protein